MGLGASSPGKLLDLQAASGLAIRYYNGSTFRAGLEVATSAGDMVATSSAGDFCIRSQSNLLVSAGGDTERLRIKSDGDVYIGNIAHSNDGGANSSYRTLTLTDTTNGAQLHLRGQSPKLFLDVTSGGNGEIYYDSGDLRILSGEPGTTSSEKLRIDSSGRMGLGTASPTTPLTVQGDTNANSVRLLGRSSDDRTDIQFYENDGSTFIASLSAQLDSMNLFLGSSSGELKITGNQTIFRSEIGAERMRLDSFWAVVDRDDRWCGRKSCSC